LPPYGGFFLDGILGMIVSKCCKSEIFVSSMDGMDYYVCEKCKIGCDIMMSLSLGMGAYDDTRREAEA
jgi:hypothetical protein